ncbi:hypothetical protein ASE74_17745 [Pedobacter sp. Leaf216]|nr:hypothetical protein ASE74_17745 [Pedobacter sp. Leaf216]
MRFKNNNSCGFLPKLLVISFKPNQPAVIIADWFCYIGKDARIGIGKRFTTYWQTKKLTKFFVSHFLVTVFLVTRKTVTKYNFHAMGS